MWILFFVVGFDNDRRQTKMLEITKFLNKTILRSFAQLAAIDGSKHGLKTNGRLISVVCGFGKHRQARNRPGRFGEDAYFIAGNTRSDVIGE